MIHKFGGLVRIKHFIGFQLVTVAALVGVVSIGLLVVASLAPLGLVRPFPDPPYWQGRVPWAQTRPISDPSTLNRRMDEPDHVYFKGLPFLSPRPSCTRGPLTIRPEPRDTRA